MCRRRRCADVAVFHGQPGGGVIGHTVPLLPASTGGDTGLLTQSVRNGSCDLTFHLPQIWRVGQPPAGEASQASMSAYLHRHVTASGFHGGRVTVLGRASLCSLALIAAGFCE